MRRLFGFFILFVLALSGSVLARNAPFSVRDVISSPMPSSLVASPEGEHFAWIFNREGVRSVWIGDAGSLESRELYSFESDNGREMSLIGFSQDGRYLILNRDDRFNPDTSVGGAKGFELYQLGVEGAELKRLASTAGAAISPRENRIAYSQRGTIHIVEVGQEGKDREVASLRGGVGQLEWSPDGDSLAFRVSRTSRQHRYSFIGVLELSTSQIQYLDASVYLDSSPKWSPDGTRIAFLRRFRSDLSGVLNSERYPEDDPWQIRVYDLRSGRAAAVWTAPAYDNFRAASLEWITDERIVFTSEKQGWRHLYSVSAKGGPITQLTEGEFEVEEHRVYATLQRIVLTSNQGDIDRRHLWRSGPKGGLVPLTSGDSIEWSPVMVNEDLLIHFGSTAQSPAHIYARRVDRQETVRLAPETLPGNFPLDQMTTPKQVVFEAADGWKIHGQLFMPPASFSGPRPAVLFFHGGPVRQMLLGWHYRGYYHRAYGLNQLLASRGYVVLAVNYRLGIGYGRAFRDVPDGGPRGASEYQDLLAAARFLRTLPEVDESRMGLWGGSYGGLMTALGLARNSDLFAAGVDLHGVHDWNQWQAWSSQSENDRSRTAWKSSPIADLESWRSPVLLIHGDDDRNVPFSETVWLVKELKNRGVDYELLIFPDDVHGFLLHKNWVAAYEATVDFFDRKLVKR